MANKYQIGDNVRIKGTFLNEDLAVADPGIVRLVYVWKTPSGVYGPYLVTHGVDAAFIKQSTGIYYYKIPADRHGTCYYRMYSEESGETAEQGEFNTETWAGGDGVPEAPLPVAAYADALDVSFLQLGTGGLARSVRSELRERVRVTQFIGTDPSGATYSDAGVQDALAEVADRVRSNVGPPYSATMPTLVFPAGRYKLSAAIGRAVGFSHLHIIGEDAIIELDPGVTFLEDIYYMLTVDDITIVGGATAFSFSTGNIDTNVCKLRGVNLLNQTVAPIVSDNTTASIMVLIEGGSRLITTSPTAKIVISAGGDVFKVADSWIGPSHTTAAAFDMTNSNLYFDNMHGVPSQSNFFAWVDMKGANVNFHASNSCRFGTESPASEAIVIWRATSGTLKINNNFCGAGTTGTLAKLYDIPDQLIIKDNDLSAGTPPIKIDASVPAASLARIGSIDNTFIVEGNAESYNEYVDAAAPVIAREGAPLVEKAVVLSSRPLVADLVLQSQGNTGAYTPSIQVSNVTRSAPNDELGVPVEQWISTAVAAYADMDYTTALSGLAAGVYTAVFDIEILTNTSCNVQIQAGNFVKPKVLTRGKHTVCLPFYYDGGAEQSVRLACYQMPNATTLQWQRFRVFTGVRQITTKRTEVEGTAAPTILQYYRGDRCYNTARTAPGAPDFWDCTASGIAGTWSANKKRGTFTATNGATSIVSDVEVRSTSLILLMPTNGAAAALMGGATALYVSARTSATSFAVTTSNGAAAAGTETFEYMILN